MDNYSITIFPNQEREDSGLIELKAELSIQYINEIKKGVDDAIKNFNNVELLVCEVSIIDLSILQYLISLKKSEKSLGKTFKISFELEDDLMELLNHAGFNNFENLMK